MPGLLSMELPVCLIGGLAVFLFFTRSLRGRSRRLPLPPGPPALPLIGNLLDYPKVSPWLAFRDMSRKYGGIISLRVMGQQIVVLNDYKAAVDLLEKRSSVYSSRPASPLFKLSGWDWSMSIMPYGQWWRRHRRAFWQYFHPGAIRSYHACQEKSARTLLSRLLKTPEDFAHPIEYALNASIMGTCYGLPVAHENDPNLNVFKAAESTLDLMNTGSNVLVESFPALASIPTWFPGTNFLERLAQSRKITAAMRDTPWLDIKALMAAGEVNTSVAGTILQRVSNSSQESLLESSEEVIGKNITAIIYFAFLLAMSLYPDVQAKAQAELDCVLGEARLPVIGDMESLPYVSAIIKETLRWHTTGPLGMPHATITDDEYNGYLIPKGSVVIANTWAFLHDPKVYPKPDEFIPERFLKGGKLGTTLPPDPVVAFGYGRRTCPGRHYANATLFIYMASILHTFNIAPPVDEDGKPIRIHPRPTTGFVS
ncbi:cytochrome P450 [Ganoderma sinense ZZ0214-1]|uniref:Cytochrome P450 n=1 Tax=Ganoderma sinense ZZ0214-1 TaxID=1077348 RepID=A0A2G8RMI9_9APHY|nr:cytochrome P450 [Ganoderma sinense ZZ0214-1]